MLCCCLKRLASSSAFKRSMVCCCLRRVASSSALSAAYLALIWATRNSIVALCSLALDREDREDLLDLVEAEDLISHAVVDCSYGNCGSGADCCCKNDLSYLTNSSRLRKILSLMYEKEGTPGLLTAFINFSHKFSIFETSCSK